MAKKNKAAKRNTTKRNARLEKAIANVWGRPRKWDDAAEFEYACRTYFALLKWNAPTIGGLSLHLGISRDTWERYRKQAIFKEICEFAETKMVAEWENILSKQGRANGAIFYLTNIRPEIFKNRGPGSDPDEPLHIKQITGVVIKRG